MYKIAIHSVPRSGSTWLGNIFNSHPNVVFKYQPLFSYAFKNYLNTNSNKEKINSFFEEISKTEDGFIDQFESVKKGLVPNFKKAKKITHICYKEVRYHHIVKNMVEKSDGVKFIFLIRNPLAVLYSWKNAPKEFRADQGWVFSNEWQYAPSKNLNLPEEYNGYEKWKESSFLFLELQKNYPDKVLVIEYSKLLHKPISTVEKLFNFTSLVFNQQTVNFLEESTSKNISDSYAVYKIKGGDTAWKKLPIHIIDYVYNDLKGTSLERYLK